MIGLPAEFESRMQQALGSDFHAFRSSLEQQSPVSVRINPRKRNKIPTIDHVPWTRYGFYLPERPKFTFDPLFHAGTYYVQEASSMFLEQVFAQHIDSIPLTVLDLSAAPGGKSTHMLSLLHPESILVSNEVIRSRATVLAENILKWGYANSVVTNNDPQDFQRLPGFFDVVVVDAPCSGEGLFRKEPESVNEWSQENVALCAGRQRRILADVWPTLKENGILIYSTCTYNEDENEANLRWLRENNDVQFLTLKIKPEWGVAESSDGGLQGYRLFPHRLRGEGFFIAAVRKKEGAPNKLRTKKRLALPSKKNIETLQTWLTQPDHFSLVQHQDYILTFPKERLDVLENIKENLKIVQAGTTLASIKHDKLVPEHGSAMSANLNIESFPSTPLTLEKAIQYLRRETFDWSDKSKGFHLVTYEEVPLGWINSLGNRFNNLYPMDWRIRSAQAL